jgi:hypothetical protein
MFKWMYLVLKQFLMLDLLLSNFMCRRKKLHVDGANEIQNMHWHNFQITILVHITYT